MGRMRAMAMIGLFAVGTVAMFLGVIWLIGFGLGLARPHLRVYGIGAGVVAVVVGVGALRVARRLSREINGEVEEPNGFPVMVREPRGSGGRGWER
jgi:hypothetical protein